jgi:hypothetical protein
VSTIVIRSSNKNSLLFADKQKQSFDYDEAEFSYSADALQAIELLMIRNHSFSVDFYTPERERFGLMENDIASRVLGYSGLLSQTGESV